MANEVEVPAFEDLEEDAFPESGWGQGRSKAKNTVLAEEDLLKCAERMKEGAKGIVLHDPVTRYGFPKTDDGLTKTKAKLQTAAENLGVSVDIRPRTDSPFDLAIRVVTRRTRERKPAANGDTPAAAPAPAATKSAAKPKGK